MNTDVLFESADTAEKTLKLLSSDEKEDFRYIICGRRPKDVGPDRFALLLPHILREGQEENLRKSISRELPRTVLVRNYEELGVLIDASYEGKMIADHSLYSFNQLSRRFLEDAGISEDTVPLELNYREIKERGAEGSSIVIYARTCLMASAQCLMKNSTGKCKKDKAGFLMELKDRKKAVFPVYANCPFCYNAVYNSVPLSLLRELGRIEGLNPKSLRVEITIEEPERAAGILRDVLNRREERLSGQGYTLGHFKKGVE